MYRDLVGFRAFGRHGELGVVVDVKGDSAADSQIIVVRGGVSDGLMYFVPDARIRSLSLEHRTVRLDIDLTEFVPRLHRDGTIELRGSALKGAADCPAGVGPTGPRAPLRSERAAAV